MKANMGKIDRIIRILVAVVIGILYFANIIHGTLAIIFLVLGGVFLLTSMVSFCPLYTLFKFSTCEKK
jgi:hypothetical protein